MTTVTFNEEQERRGVILAASGVSPHLIRELAQRLADPTLALDVLWARRHRYVEGQFLNQGKYDEVAVKLVLSEVEMLVERVNHFEDITITKEEDFAEWGVEGIEWKWVESPFGRGRVKL